MKFWPMKNHCLQDEGVDCSSHRLKLEIRPMVGYSQLSPFTTCCRHRHIMYVNQSYLLCCICVGFWRFSKGFLSSQWSSPLEGRGGGSNPSIGLISFASPFDEGLSLGNVIQILWEEDGGDSSNMKFFMLYPRGREVRSWGNIRAFRSVESQATAEIFLAHDHMAGVRSVSMTWMQNILDQNLINFNF